MPVARLDIDDVDFMEALANERPSDDTREYETRYLQLSRGAFGGSFETFRTTDTLFARAVGLGDDEDPVPRERAIPTASLQCYGARIRLQGSTPADRTCFWILLPSSGPVQWRGAPVPPGSLIEHPPSSELDLVTEGFEVATFSFRNEVRDAMFRSTGHRSAVGAAPLPTGSASRLGSLVREYLWGLRSGAGAPGLALRIQDEFVSRLAGLPACVIPRVSGERRRRATRRAEAYLRDRLHGPVPADELAELAEVPLRTLQDGFRREFGVSPHTFHVRLRMQAAKRRLEAGSTASTRVSDVALAFGFFHFGRFAVDYRRLFGESPVAALRRRPAACSGQSGLRRLRGVPSLAQSG